MGNSMKNQFDQLIEESSDSSDKIIVLEEAKKEKKKVLLMNKLLNTSIDSMKIEYKKKLSHLNKEFSEMKENYEHCQEDRDNYIKQNHSLSLEKQDINMRSLAKIESSKGLINTKDQEISSILGEIVSLKSKISFFEEEENAKVNHLCTELQKKDESLREKDKETAETVGHLMNTLRTTNGQLGIIQDEKKNNTISLVEVDLQNKVNCLTKDLNKNKKIQDDIYHFISDFTSKNKISFSDNIDIVTAVKGIILTLRQDLNVRLDISSGIDYNETQYSPNTKEMISKHSSLINNLVQMKKNINGVLTPKKTLKSASFNENENDFLHLKSELTAKNKLLCSMAKQIDDLVYDMTVSKQLLNKKEAILHDLRDSIVDHENERKDLHHKTKVMQSSVNEMEHSSKAESIRRKKIQKDYHLLQRKTKTLFQDCRSGKIEILKGPQVEIDDTNGSNDKKKTLVAASMLLNQMFDRNTKLQIGTAFRKWSCETSKCHAFSDQIDVAREMASQLQKTREKLAALKIHLNKDGLLN